MATFNMPAWYTQREAATAIGQLQQQAASAAKTQWFPISECGCCGAPIAQDEDLCEKCKQVAQAASAHQSDPQCFEMGGEACFGCGTCEGKDDADLDRFVWGEGEMFCRLDVSMCKGCPDHDSCAL